MEKDDFTAISLKSEELERLSLLVFINPIEKGVLDCGDRLSADFFVDPLLFEAVLRVENYFRPARIRFLEKMVFRLLRYFQVHASMTLGPAQIKTFANENSNLSDEQLIRSALKKIRQIFSLKPKITIGEFGEAYNGAKKYGRLLNLVYQKIVFDSILSSPSVRNQPPGSRDHQHS